MRLKHEKIEHIARVIHDSLAVNPTVTVRGDEEEIVMLIRGTITEDLKAEDEIEEEARRLLEGHSDEIQRKGVSFDRMLLKTKQRLARERKMVI